MRWFLQVQLRKIPLQLLEILLKIVSLHVKLEIKWIRTERKEKFHMQSVVILLKDGCSVRHMFCTILVPLSVSKVLGKHVWSSSYLVLVFFKEKSYSHGKFTERYYFCYNYFTPIFSNRYFSELLFLIGDRKINKIYQRKSKSDNRLWPLESDH